MHIRYYVDLTQYERNELEALLSGGEHPRTVAQAGTAPSGGGSRGERRENRHQCSGRWLDRKRRFVEGT